MYYQNVLKSLIAAKAKIENPDNWIQREYACDKDGNSLLPSNSRACKWCASGALISATDLGDDDTDNIYFYALRILNEASLELGHFSVIALNDMTNHKTVMQMYDLAIEYVKTKLNN